MRTHCRHEEHAASRRTPRAHSVGSAYRSSSLGLARSFRSRPRAGVCDRQEVSAQASEQPHKRSERTKGLADGPIGCGAPGVVGAPRVSASGVAAVCPAGPCSATEENDLYFISIHLSSYPGPPRGAALLSYSAVNYLAPHSKESRRHLASFWAAQEGPRPSGSACPSPPLAYVT